VRAALAFLAHRCARRSPAARFLVAVEHMMHSAILAVSGRETGATLFGPADMQLAANVQVKTIEGHYTGHFKSVVTKPQSTPPHARTFSTVALTSTHS